MLIDTGYEEGGQYIVQDLTDLGVTKIDYFMITHGHGDHMGAIEIICDAFEVDTFLYQKYATLSSQLTGVVASENAEVMVCVRGRKPNFGRGGSCFFC